MNNQNNNGQMKRKQFSLWQRLNGRHEELSDPSDDEDFRAHLRWGPLLLSPEEAVQHFAAIGATGSGKSTILQLLLQDIVPTIQKGTDRRLLIYDPKQDVLPTLAGLSCKAPVIVTDPFDSRSSAWDMALDIQEPRVALEIAFTLIPDEPESQPFFPAASRHFLYGIMLSYMWRKLDWQFSDLLRPLSSPKLLRRVLLACPHTKNIVTRYFQDRKGLISVLATLATKTLAYESIASAWEASSRKFSIGEWVRTEKVLVLGSSETSRHAIDAINRCIFKRGSDLTLALGDSTSRRSWFILDELSEAGGGMLPGLVSLTKKGRSVGACVALAFQSIAGLRQKTSYGPELTAEILGQIGNRFIGKLECPETAEWSAKLFGDQEVKQSAVSHTYGTENTVSHNEQFVTRPAVLAAEFLSLPPCNIENGLTAWYLCRNQQGVFSANLPGRELFTQDIIPKSDQVLGFMPRPPECQFLRPWTREEKATFAPKPPKKKKAAAPNKTDRFEGLDDI